MTMSNGDFVEPLNAFKQEQENLPSFKGNLCGKRREETAERQSEKLFDCTAI